MAQMTAQKSWIIDAWTLDLSATTAVFLDSSAPHTSIFSCAPSRAALPRDSSNAALLQVTLADILHWRHFLSKTFYTETILHRGNFHRRHFTSKTFYIEDIWHQRHFTAKTFYRKDILPQRPIKTSHINDFLHQKICHTKDILHRGLLHQRHFISKTFYIDYIFHQRLIREVKCTRINNEINTHE